MWAIRCKHFGIVEDPCVILENNFKTNQNRNMVQTFDLKIPEDREDWIPCESAFGCLAIYRTKVLLDPNRSYVGDTTCEHVSLNRGLKGYIVPYLLSGLEYIGGIDTVFDRFN
jgi:hypothetical protein